MTAEQWAWVFVFGCLGALLGLLWILLFWGVTDFPLTPAWNKAFILVPLGNALWYSGVLALAYRMGWG